MVKKLSPLGIAVTFSAVTGIAAIVVGAVLNSPDDQLDGSVIQTETPIKQPEIQKTYEFYIEKYGRRYSIWEGMVIENYDNERIVGSNEFDGYYYDFDNQLLIGMNEKDAFYKPFPTVEIAKAGSPVTITHHFQRVREIGCEVVQVYFDRSATSEYGDPPEDVIAFNARHCPQSPD